MFKRSWLIYLAIFAALTVPPWLRAQHSQAAENTPVLAAASQEQPVIAAMFYSNWCGACQILDPKIEAVKPDFAGHKVDFVKFDFSYALMRGKALQKLADEKGLDDIYTKNKGRTGFMLLIDPASEQILDIITMRDSKASIAAKLQRSLHRPAATAPAVSG